MDTDSAQKAIATKEWKKAVASYESSDTRRSLWQLANSVFPFLLLWYLMYRSLEISYWLTLLLAFPTAGLMIRIFIIFHDCGHGSFFESKRANTVVGYITGILTFTPYHHWRHHHAIHHASAGDLDRRGVGDVMIWTVDEFRAATAWKKLVYRISHHPLIVFTVGAWGIFVLAHRFPTKPGGKREATSVHLTNLALLAIFLVLSVLIGWQAVLLVQIPILMIATSAGVWLFFIQHTYQGVYWARHNEWQYAMVGLQGASFYKLPKMLQWFTGNIGYHHIHHLSPRVPNYKLEACHNASSLLQKVPPLTLTNSLRSLSFRLYDEARRMLVGYDTIKA